MACTSGWSALPITTTLPAGGGGRGDEAVYPRDVRAGGVGYLGSGGAESVLTPGGDSVGADNDPVPRPDLLRRGDDGQSALRERAHHVFVVNERPQAQAGTLLQQFIRHLDGAGHAEAEARAPGYYNFAHALSPSLSSYMRSMMPSASCSYSLWLCPSTLYGSPIRSCTRENSFLRLGM